MDLSAEERECIELLARAWNAYQRTSHNTRDCVEFMQAIHAAQNVVLSSYALRVLVANKLEVIVQ